MYQSEQTAQKLQAIDRRIFESEGDLARTGDFLDHLGGSPAAATDYMSAMRSFQEGDLRTLRRRRLDLMTCECGGEVGG